MELSADNSSTACSCYLCGPVCCSVKKESRLKESRPSVCLSLIDKCLHALVIIAYLSILCFFSFCSKQLTTLQQASKPPVRNLGFSAILHHHTVLSKKCGWTRSGCCVQEQCSLKTGWEAEWTFYFCITAPYHLAKALPKNEYDMCQYQLMVDY